MTTPIRTAPSSAPLARLGVSAIWRQLATLVTISTAAVGLVFGCSTDDAALPAPGAGPATGSVELRCAEGTTQSCATTLAVEGKKLSCYEGQRTCVGGTWGPCLDGTVVEREAPDPRAIAQLRAQDTGVPWELCLAAGFGTAGAAGVAGAAGAPSIVPVFNNPCDPRCRIQYRPGTYPGMTTGGSVRGDRTKVLGHFALPPTPPCTDGSDCQANTRCEEPTTDSCAHLTCLVGGALDPACDPCVTDICDPSDGDGDADCCTVAWDAACVAMVKTVCDGFCADDICTHSPCDEGEGLVSGCDDPTGCVADICATDPDCCSSGVGNWDATCVAAVDTECGMFVTIPSCFDGLQNGGETGVDCGGATCPACATCTDSLMNGTETGVDCGGSCPTACPTCSDGEMNGTETGIDCGGGTCPDCATCTDGLLNGPETGIDCGGTCPDDCPDGQGCAGDGDCLSGDCDGGICVCGDGLTNNGESGTDCGGGCPDCIDGETCTVAGDCLSGTCTSGECVCGDGSENNGETDVDCGGPCGATCLDGQTCTADGDCDSGDCTGGLCLCGDGLLDNNETDVDCGGPCGASCSNGEFCDADGDCTSGICHSGTCIACGDSLKNGLETDVDCGGADCGATCPDGYDCLANGDCISGSCAGNLCRSCSDTIKNGNETDVDCGGTDCGATCAVGDTCSVTSDCLAPAECTAGVCTTPVSCFNGLKDGTETDVDCGGSCAADCAFRQGCSGNADCLSSSCVSNVCTRHLCEYAALGAGSVNSSVMFKVKGARLGTSNLTLTGSTSTLVNSFANVDIANGGTTWLSTPSTVSGSLASSGSLNLTDWSVAGTAYYTGTLVYAPAGTVPNREQSNQVALPTITNKDASFSCTDWSNQKWSSWGTPPLTGATLTPGQYGNVTVDSSYELPFGNGDYYFQSLTVDTGRLKVPPAGSVANVYVCGNVAFKGATAQMTGVGAPASPLAGLRLRIYTKSSSSNAIDFSGYGPYFGLFMAPNGTVQTSYSAKVAGPVWANGVKSVTDWSSNGNTIDVNGGTWSYTGGAITEATCRSSLGGYIAANTGTPPATSPLLRPAVEDEVRVELAANDAAPVQAAPTAPAVLARAETAPAALAPAPAATVPLLDPASYGPLADYVVTARGAPEPAWAPLPGTITPAWAVAEQSYSAAVNGDWCTYTFYSDGDLSIDNANLANPSSGSAKIAARGNVYLRNASSRLTLLPNDPLIAGGYVIMRAGAQISGSVAAIGNPPTLPAAGDYLGQAAGPVQILDNSATTITKNAASTLGYAVWAQPVIAGNKAVTINAGRVVGGVKTSAATNVSLVSGGTNPNGVSINATKPTLEVASFDAPPTASCPGGTVVSGPPYNLAAGTNAGTVYLGGSIVFQSPGLYTFQNLTVFSSSSFTFPTTATPSNPVRIVVCGKVNFDGRIQIVTPTPPTLGVRWWVLGTDTSTWDPAFKMTANDPACTTCGFFGALSVPNGKAQFDQYINLWGMAHAKELYTTGINIVQAPPSADACNTDLCASVVCTAPNECQTPGTCNPATGLCSAPTNKAFGTACTADSNPCTDDICNAGTCTHPNDNTNTCSDSNACTLTDTCSAGACVGSNPVVCTTTECKNPGTCNTSTGVCSAATNKANGTACTDDGNSCTDDVCSSGSCAHPNDDTNACSDGDACTSDVCSAGSCVGTAITCDDGKDCTDDACDSVTGCEHVADNTNTCSDSNPCTTDACTAGVCISTMMTCNDGNPCTDDDCNTTTGACINSPDTTNACSDGDACTDDACSAAGACVSAGIDCSDANPCTDDSCDTTIGCINDPDVTNPCTDGDACTDDACSVAGACVSTAITCSDANVCTDDSCNPATGCVHTNDDTNPCSDGSACTTELCAAGVCLATGIVCDDANVCTDDSCDPATGCTYAPDDTNPCSDGSVCTTDACSAGSCVSTAITCDDGDTCTTDSCDPATGCQTAEIPLCGPQCEFNPDHSACVPWADGEQDDACVGKPDLALDIPCLDAALHGRMPVCNHGMAPAPNGVKVHFFPYDPAAPALGNWGLDDASGAVAALTCTSTDPILPGACVPVDCGAFPDDGAQYLVMVNPSADGVVDECYHQDNWSAFLSSRTDGACLADLTTTSFEETFDPAECEPGQGIRWQFFAWEAYVPDDAEVRFALRSCLDAASTDCSAWIELDADLPAMLPTFPAGTRNVMAANHDEDSDPVAAPNPEVRGRASCDFSDAFDPTRRCPVVLGDVLRKDDPYVQMRATLIPNSTFTDAPVLLNRYITHSCVDDE